jgi:peptide deformylase
MAILPIIVAPDPRLKKVCAPVASVNDGTRRLLDDLVETLNDADGLGIAAPQVGVLKRVLIVSVPDEEGSRSPLFMVNPEIVQKSSEVGIYNEGCLSLPDYYEEVERPLEVVVRFLDREGKEQTLEMNGVLAVCAQHEMDHLDGILFVDHLSLLKRSIILRKLAKAKKQMQTDAV